MLECILWRDRHNIGDHNVPCRQAAPVLPVLLVQARIDQIGTRNQSNHVPLIVNDHQSTYILFRHLTGHILNWRLTAAGQHTNMHHLANCSIHGTSLSRIAVQIDPVISLV